MSKRIFNVASYKRDEFLLKTIASIYNQADVINIALNSHSEIPSGLRDSKINCYFTDNSIGDGFKFLRLEESQGYYFTIDDDLIYPSSYSQYLIDKFEFYKRKYIVSLHGRTFQEASIQSYYRSPHYAFRCLDYVINDILVQFGGTGVMMFHTDLLKFSYKDIKLPNMADIWLSKFAKERGIEIMCLEHNYNYLKYQEGVREETIFDNYKYNDNLQTDLANIILKHGHNK